MSTMARRSTSRHSRGRCRARSRDRAAAARTSSAAPSSTTSGRRSRCSCSPASSRSEWPGSGSRARPRSSRSGGDRGARSRRSERADPENRGRARVRLRGDERRFYIAIDRLPLGTVAAIEFLARHRARGSSVPGRGRNASALALAVAGVYLLTERAARRRARRARLRLRECCAVRRLHRARAPARAKSRSSDDSTASRPQSLVAAIVVTPIAGSERRTRRSRIPSTARRGIGVGLASSVIPYVFDQLAMARLCAARRTRSWSHCCRRRRRSIGVVVLAADPDCARDRRCRARRGGDGGASRGPTLIGPDIS